MSAPKVRVALRIPPVEQHELLRLLAINCPGFVVIDPSPCCECGVWFDGADEALEAGDFCLCFACYSLNICANKGGSLRAPTEDEMLAVAAHSGFQALRRSMIQTRPLAEKMMNDLVYRGEKPR